MTKLFISGYGVAGSGDTFAIIKDEIAKLTTFKTKASKTGVVFCRKGLTIDKAEQELPVGTDISSAYQWGEERESEFGGIFRVEERRSTQSLQVSDAKSADQG